MSESRGPAEPSMEEILASIRRIIAHESQEGVAGSRPAEALPPAAAQGASGGDVLLLTEMVADDGSVISLAEIRASGARAASVPPPGPAAAGESENGAAAPVVPFAVEPAAQVSPSTPDDQEVEKASVTSETEKKEGLVSSESRAAAAAAFSELTRHVARERDAALGGGRLVEDLVREALEPMLKNWLDTHLPVMVERIVRQEIQRVVRQAEDIA